mmetsp:Transcript_466/g.1609  ORF Transcript_466/g.1609 Transcript_466/m.1609 type:complete len:217 (+) Transcript_466:1585-2235(+)
MELISSSLDARDSFMLEFSCSATFKLLLVSAISVSNLDLVSERSSSILLLASVISSSSIIIDFNLLSVRSRWCSSSLRSASFLSRFWSASVAFVWKVVTLCSSSRFSLFNFLASSSASARSLSRCFSFFSIGSKSRSLNCACWRSFSTSLHFDSARCSLFSASSVRDRALSRSLVTCLIRSLSSLSWVFRSRTRRSSSSIFLSSLSFSFSRRFTSF